jgi:hypothetical protein
MRKSLQEQLRALEQLSSLSSREAAQRDIVPPQPLPAPSGQSNRASSSRAITSVTQSFAIGGGAGCGKLGQDALDALAITGIRHAFAASRMPAVTDRGDDDVGFPLAAPRDCEVVGEGPSLGRGGEAERHRVYPSVRPAARARASGNV